MTTKHKFIAGDFIALQPNPAAERMPVVLGHLNISDGVYIGVGGNRVFIPEGATLQVTADSKVMPARMDAAPYPLIAAGVVNSPDWTHRFKKLS